MVAGRGGGRRSGGGGKLLLALLLAALLLGLAFALYERQRFFEEATYYRVRFHGEEVRRRACESELEQLRAETAARIAELEGNLTSLRRELRACSSELRELLGALVVNDTLTAEMRPDFTYWLVVVVPRGYRLRLSVSFTSTDSPIAAYLLSDQLWAQYWRDGWIPGYIVKTERALNGSFTVSLTSARRTEVYYIVFREAGRATKVTITVTAFFERV